ncbi:MAG: hypothetical protein ACF8NJ_00980, partial [Phycisphaerales bacterium JB038]
MRLVPASLALACAFASSLPAQQQCASRNDDGTLRTDVSMGGANLSLGMKLIAGSSFTLSAAQVHTGVRSGPASFAVWSHDPNGDRPLANLSGDGAYQQTTAIAWQGAVLPSPIPLTAGQVFWLVWSMPNSSRTPYATTITDPIPYRGSFDGGQTWNGANGGASPWPGQAYKIRMFCPYATNPVVHVGAGKPGVNGIPTHTVTGWAAMFNDLSFILENAAPGAPALFLLGPQPGGPIQLPGVAD